MKSRFKVIGLGKTAIPSKSAAVQHFAPQEGASSDTSTRKLNLVHSATKFDPIVSSVLIRLVSDCEKLGASEVFVGQPNKVDYECFAENSNFSGRIPIALYDWMLRTAKPGEALCIELEIDSVREIHLGLTRGHPRPIFCLSWTRDSAPKMGPDQIEFTANSCPVSPPVRAKSGPAEILLVEDDLRFSQIVSKVLEDHGFKVFRASHGREALDLLASASPQLIICDVHMPYLDGPALLLELKRIGLNTPFIVLSGDEEALTEAEMVLLGADAYIRKQEDPRVLIAWCRRLTAIREASRE